jgi:hypothetical protein
VQLLALTKDSENEIKALKEQAAQKQQEELRNKQTASRSAE